MSCGELFLKSASTTFTGYFLIVSISFILYGLLSTYYLLKVNTVETLEEELVSVPSVALILFGLLILLFIVLGCCAVCREIPCCLETYSIFLVVLSVAQIGLGIFCIVRFHDFNDQFAKRIYNDVTQMYLNYTENPMQLDDTQEWMGCCGVNGPKNWADDNREIPLSCCEEIVEECSMASPSLFSDGCSFMAFSYITSTNYIIGWSLIIVGVTEVIAAMMGITLSCAYWRHSRIMWI